jgi:hypothetical protein
MIMMMRHVVTSAVSSHALIQQYHNIIWFACFFRQCDSRTQFAQLAALVVVVVLVLVLVLVLVVVVLVCADSHWEWRIYFRRDVIAIHLGHSWGGN